MPNTTAYRFGDLVLVLFPFPFTDQTGIKKRPAIVVSSESQHVPAASGGPFRRETPHPPARFFSNACRWRAASSSLPQASYSRTTRCRASKVRR